MTTEVQTSPTDLARALVRAEMWDLYLQADNNPTTEPYGLTSSMIVTRYGLDWGAYADKPKAMQMVRNALNNEFVDGNLAKLKTESDYATVRIGMEQLYVDPHVRFPGYVTWRYIDECAVR